MKIEFRSVYKRYAYEWIFKEVNFTIEKGDKVGIVGPNGSGKSTILRILLGTLDPSQGSMIYFVDDIEIPVNAIYKQFSFTAPYMELPGNFTLKEIVKFHFAFRKPLPGIKPTDLAEIAYLQKSKNKEFRQFSSGMQQRLKLALALCTASNAVVLDEPTTNLDDEAKAWFHELVAKYLGDRTLIIATNETADLQLCDKRLSVLDYK